MVAISSATRSADIIRTWCFSLSCHVSWNNLVSIKSDPHFRIIRDKVEECELCDAYHNPPFYLFVVNAKIPVWFKLFCN